MKNLIRLLGIICLCGVSTFAQKVGKPETIKLVEVPREIVLQVIAVQPNCPIKFEDVRSVAGTEGGFGNSYLLRNIGTKPIQSITIASTDGSINTYAKEKGVFLMPGQLTPQIQSCDECAENEIVPLTNELREKLNLKGSMQSVVVLMVVNIVFTDGTRYDDEKTYKGLMKLFESLEEAVHQQKQRNSKP